MLYLDPSVHFHKIEVPILLQKEFYGSCIYIARCLCRLDAASPIFLRSSSDSATDGDSSIIF